MRSLICTLLLLATATAATAETSPEAKVWLEKITALPDSGAYSFSMNADISGMPGTPPGAKATMDGKMTQSGRRHSAMDLKIDLGGQGSTQAPAPAMGPMTMKAISDGTTLWTEMLMMGKTQVMKISLDQAEKLAKQNGGMSPSAGMDPMAQVEAMSKMMDFQLVGQQGNLVTLKGIAKPDAPMRAAGMDSMTMVIDSRTGFFDRISLGDGKIEIRFTDFKRLGTVDPAMFKYTPPAGAQVMDLGPMLEQQMKAMQSQPAPTN